MGKTEKKQNENDVTKVTKISKTKRPNYGMNETTVCKYRATGNVKASMFIYVYIFYYTFASKHQTF